MNTVFVAAATTLTSMNRLPNSSLCIFGHPLPRISTAEPAIPIPIPTILAQWSRSRKISDDTTSVTIGAIVASVEASSGLVYFAPHSIMNSCP